MKKTTANYGTGESLMFSFFVLCFAPVLIFAFGYSVTYQAAWMIVASSIITHITWTIIRVEKRQVSQSLIFSIIAWLLSLALGSIFIEITYDGQNYHMGAILGLAQGWNPILENIGTPYNSRAIWIEHYPKALWQAQSTLSVVTGNIEISKSITMVPCLAACFYLFQFFQDIKKSLFLNIFVVALMVFSPVVVTQSITYMNDGVASAILLFMAFSLFSSLSKNDQRGLFISAICLPILAGLKFSTLGMALIYLFALLPFIFFIWHWKTNLRALITFTVAGFVAIFLNWNPYITNTIEHHHPFYPLKGPGSIEIMEPNTPDSMKEMNWVQKRFAGYFLQGTKTGPLEAPSLKVFLQRKNGLNDRRVGGFGPLFGYIFALSVISGILLFVRSTSQQKKYVLAFSIPLLTTILLHPEGWWARYVAHLWALPILVAYCTHLKSEIETRIIGKIILVLAATQVFLSGYKHIENYHYRTESVFQYLEELNGKSIQMKGGNIGFTGILERLTQNNVKVYLTNDLTCEKPKEFPMSFRTRFFCIVEDSSEVLKGTLYTSPLN